MLTRDQHTEILKQTLNNIFGLPNESVDQFIASLESDASIELVKQRIDVMPSETLEQLTSLIDGASSDNSTDNIELGDPDTEQMSNFYQQHVDYRSDDPKQEFEEAQLNVAGLLTRLRKYATANASESALLSHGDRLSEMNVTDAETIISADADDRIDPATKQRISKLDASGNKAGADALRRREIRKRNLQRNGQPRTPLDGVIDAKKRELAMAMQRKQRNFGDNNDAAI